jgi:hypothetical protein
MAFHALRVGYLAVLAGICFSSPGQAIVVFGGGCSSNCQHVYSLMGAGYDTVVPNQISSEGDPPYSGDIVFVGPPTDNILSADITIPSLGLTFTNITGQALNGSQYDVTLEDTTNTYSLDLVLDDAAALFAGLDGPSVDTTSALFDGGILVGDDFAGALDVPAPPALPVFATALAMLGFFAWRRKQSDATG